MPAYNDPVELGTVLRRHRIARGLKQDEVAKLLEVTQPTVHRWEQGRRPPAEFFDRLALFLELDRDRVIRLAHSPAEDDGLGDTLVASHSARWYTLPIEERKRLAEQIRALLDEER